MSKKFTIEDALKKPEDIDFFKFASCDTFGGLASNGQCRLYKHKGIFIGFENFKWTVFASSNPKAKWYRGSQDTNMDGDSRPWSDTARLIRLDKLPPEAQELACQWVQEAIEICRQKIKEKREEERKRYQKEVVDPWMEAVYANSS